MCTAICIILLLLEGLGLLTWVLINSFSAGSAVVRSIMAYYIMHMQSDSLVCFCVQNFEHFWPGLGGTERDYAWVLISFSIFETGLIPPVTIMLGTLPYTVSLLTMMALYGASGIVYACATEVWMVIVARCLMGSGALFTSAVIYTYIGEIGTTMDEIRKKHGKAPRKHALYIMATFFSSGANALLLGMCYRGPQKCYFSICIL